MAATEETVPEQQQHQGKERFGRALTMLFIVLALLGLFATFLLMITGFSQLRNSYHTQNGTSIFLNDSTCSSLPMSKFRPFRWKMEMVEGVMLDCTWKGGLSAVRSLICFASFAAFLPLFFALFYSRPRWMWAFVGASGGIALLFFVMVCSDGAALSRGSRYCKEDMPGAPFLPELELHHDFRISCHQGTYVGLVFADVLAFISYAALSLFAVFYVRMGMTSGGLFSREEQKPILQAEAPPPVAPAKPVPAGPISDETLQQDVTGSNPFDPKTAAAAAAAAAQQPATTAFSETDSAVAH